MVRQPGTHRDRPGSKEIDEVLAACRVLVAISVASLNAIEDDVTAEQLRVLVVVSGHEARTLTEVAAETGIHLSKASRVCDRMVRNGMLARTDDPVDRRTLRLSLTEAGERVLRAVAAARRAAIAPALRRMAPARRADLLTAMTEFTEACRIPPGTDLSALGWSAPPGEQH